MLPTAYWLQPSEKKSHYQKIRSTDSSNICGLEATSFLLSREPYGSTHQAISPSNFTIRPEQIKPNQFLDFQLNGDAELQLAGWIPDLSSSDFVVLEDPDSVVVTGRRASGFNGTLFVVENRVNLSTEDHPIQTLVLRVPTENDISPTV